MENFKFVDGRLIHQEFMCECGKKHTVPIQEVIVKRGALDETGKILDRLDLLHFQVFSLLDLGRRLVLGLRCDGPEKPYAVLFDQLDRALGQRVALADPELPPVDLSLAPSIALQVQERLADRLGCAPQVQKSIYRLDVESNGRDLC